MHVITKIILTLTVFTVFLNQLSAQTNFFETVTSRSALPKAVETVKNIKKMNVVRLDEAAMRSYLLSAPLEFENNGQFLALEIPLPNGKTETFGIVESPILAPAIAAQNPEIKTYTGNGLRNKQTIIRFALTSNGFSAILLNCDGGDAVYFEKYSKESNDLYFSYFTRDAVAPQGDLKSRCGIGLLDEEHHRHQSAPNNQIDERNNTGGTLRRYRLAMVSSGEFTAVHGGTKASALAAIVVYVNTMVAVYRNELSVTFILVNGTNLMYTNPATDPYTTDDQIANLDENQATCDTATFSQPGGGTITGSAGYDIGHVWGFVGGSGGGIASFEGVCYNVTKAQGVSGEGAGYGQVFFDQLVLHEVGHQFGMSHSYNSSIPVCTTRNPPTSVEPGSGATIMSYGFTCEDDDYFSSTSVGPILTFHTVNYSQAEAYIANTNPGWGGDCVVNISTGNSPPVVTMPANVTIPKSTPFTLTGSATDPNGNALTYSWEGTNIGTMTPNLTTLANTAQPPFFRTYEASTSPSRTFPILDRILDGTNYAKGDKLPSVGIVTTHNLSVRDNVATGGGLSFGSVTVTVDGAIGPFLETTNLSGSYPALSAQTINWSVNGTNTATPNIKITLSTDGGQTFPFTLLASTPNDGTQSVILPNSLTSTARIKVEAIGNIFFDISNIDFTITAALPVELVRFEASLKNQNDALLQWQTTAESRNNGYEIEMGTDSEMFKKMGFVKAHGTTSVSGNYDFTVKNLPSGGYYFRLKIIDNNGDFKYSPIEALQIGYGSDLIRIYPNPSTDGGFSIDPTATKSDQISVSITNSVGQIVSTSVFENASVPVQMHINTPGVYNVAITLDNGTTIIKKIVFLK